MKNRQNIFLLIEPPIDPWSFPSKIGYAYMNRFTIDEDAAIELIGVGHLSKASVHKHDFGTNGTSRVEDFDYDYRIIDDAIEKASTDEENTHLIIAGDFSFYPNSLQVAIHRSMKKNNMKKILFTMLKLYRKNLITKEKVERYCTEYFFSHTPFGFIHNERELKEAEQHLNESVFDDLESTFQHLKSGNENEACSKNLLPVMSYYIPKLTQKELNLVDVKDELYLKTFWNVRRPFLSVDVNPAEMKRSESNSKFVNGVAKAGCQIDTDKSLPCTKANRG